MKPIPKIIASTILASLATTANAQVSLIANLANDLSTTLNSIPIGELPVISDAFTIAGPIAISEVSTTLLPLLVDLPGANLIVGPVVPLGTQAIGMISPYFDILPLTELPGLSALPGGGL
tara:strand:- start:260 stop:619 length:360 start_codon:yes stop_codon:yes gene_type:complete